MSVEPRFRRIYMYDENGNIISGSNPAPVYLTDGTNDAVINSDGQLHTVLRGTLDEGNSTTDNLLANDTFTGTAIDTLDYSALTISVHSDVASAIDGLVVQYSVDGIDWHDGEVYTIIAGANKFFTPTLQSRYMRIIYTNGGTDTSDFHIHTTLRKSPIKWSSHNITDPIKDEDDAQLIKAVITGKRVDGVYDNVSLTNGSNMKVSLEELENGISSNSNSQLNVTPFHADGTEGALITGIDYVSGKSGIDASTETLQTIDYQHHEIHSGSSYFIRSVATLAINNVFDMQFTTPDTAKWPHFTFMISVAAETEYYIYEGATVITPGTTITAFNANRNSTNTSGITIAIISNTSLVNANADTSVAAATELEHGITGAGRNGGEAARTDELVLKQNTTYCFRVIANAAGYINFRISWYEHTDKN